MKLELKHITPYLPYSLKCHAMGEFKFGTEDSDTPIPEIFLLNGVLLNNKASIMCLGEKTLIDFDELFPILHPLSDITKEIEVNGEKFIPIIELAKIAMEYMDFDLFKLSEFGEVISEGFNSHIRFLYEESTCNFVKSSGYNWDNLDVFYQLQLFQKLFEWRFDVFKLIDNKLAIDINTL